MIKKTILTTMTTGILIIIGIITQHFLTKYLTLEEYGKFQLMLSWIVLLSFFSLNSFNTLVTKSTTQKYPRFFITANKICFICSLIGSLVFLIISGVYKSEVKNFIMIAIFFPFYSGLNMAQSFYLGTRQFKKYSLIIISTQLILSLSQILATYLFKESSQLLFYTLLITSVTNLAITIHISIRIKEEYDEKKEKELIKYGIELTAVNIINTISSRIQYIILATLTNNATLAIYAVSQIIPEKMKSIFKSATNPYSVHLASNKEETSIKLARKSIWLLFLLGICMTTVIGLITPRAVLIIFGQEYQQAIWYTILLLSTTIFIPVNVIINSIIIYHNHKKFYRNSTIFTNLLQISLFSILIPPFQIYGIIATIFTTTIVTTIINTVWLSRQPFSANKKILTLNKTNAMERCNKIQVNTRINGENILKVIEADYLSCREKYPLWIKVIAKLSDTKQI